MGVHPHCLLELEQLQKASNREGGQINWRRWNVKCFLGVVDRRPGVLSAWLHWGNSVGEALA